MESRSSKENPYRDYYIWREQGQNRNPGQTRNLGEICNMDENREPNNWESVFGGPALGV